MSSKWKWMGCGEVEVLCVCEAMNALKPESTRKRKDALSYQDIATQWLGQMPYLVLAKRRYTGKQSGEQISLDQLRDAFNYRYKTTSGATAYWFDWFVQNFPLWRVIQQGNNLTAKVTQVMINFDPIQALALVDPQQVYDAWLSEVDQLRLQHPDREYLIDEIAVDLENVQRYIKQTTESLQLQTNQWIKKQMSINLAEALVIEAFCMASGAVQESPLTGQTWHVVPQVYYQHPVFARRYYVTSIAFQNMHSRLREVITGTGWAWDLNSSVWSFYKLMCSVAGIESSVITDMIHNKVQFRQRISQVFTSTSEHKRVTKTKQAITALGFGAKPSAFGGLDKIIRNSTELQAFNQHPDIVQLKRVQAELLDWVKQHYATDIQQLKSDPEFTTGRQFNHKKFLAMLYQRYETAVMQELIHTFQANRSELVLWVHDGVYLRGPAPDGIWNSVLKSINPFAGAELRKISGQVYSNPAQHAEVNQHALRMAAEQQAATAWAVQRSDSEFC